MAVIEPAAAIRRAQALELSGARQRRRVDSLRVQLMDRRAARERAHERCVEKQHEVDAADAVVEAHRERLHAMQAQAFSADAWVDGVRVLDVLRERHAEKLGSLRKLEAALAAADEQIAESRRELGGAQARVELLTDQAKRLRTKLGVNREERDDEAIGEDVQARRSSQWAAV